MRPLGSGVQGCFFCLFFFRFLASIAARFLVPLHAKKHFLGCFGRRVSVYLLEASFFLSSLFDF